MSRPPCVACYDVAASRHGGEFPSKHFAQVRHGQCLSDLDCDWNLEFRERPGAVIAKFVWSGVLAVFELDECLHHFPVTHVGNADGGRVEYSRMRIQDLLDLPREYFEA